MKVKEIVQPILVMAVSAGVLWLFGKGLVQLLHWAYGAFGGKK